MSELEPAISRKSGLSPLWIIPLVALVVGIWMVIQSYLAEGPIVTIDFETAESLVAGKTAVKMLDVEVGQVQEVSLKPDLSGVTVTVQLNKEITSLLREDTRFWVVRAQVGAAGITGIGTILSGAYIMLAPGEGKTGTRKFKGLESPPVTKVGTPGLHLTLTSKRASIKVGDAIVYEGFKVGRVEAMEFDAAAELARYQIFIDAPYDKLIHTSTRFWDVSGIDIDASAEGLQVSIGSVATVLTGGVSFAKPPGVPVGDPVTTDHTFVLHRSYSDILQTPYEHKLQYVVAFAQAIGGLYPGAPVTFRGIPVGQVDQVLLNTITATRIDGTGAPIPVLISLEPGRLSLPDTEASVDALREGITRGISNGLRASLQTGNLLTGKQLITFDYHPDAPPAQITEFGDYQMLPSMETGFGRLQEQISTLLAKVNALPLDQTVADANATLVKAERLLTSMNEGMGSLNQILAADGTQSLTTDLSGTLQELRSVLNGLSEDAELYQDANTSLNSLNSTLENLNRLVRQLSEKPNSLIFAPAPTKDPIPEARP